MLRANGMEAVGRTADQKLVKEAHDRAAGSMRCLMVEWAIHQFHKESGRWPRSVVELVPSVLTRVPLNPDTNQPLVYPANSAGELTDDLAGIGMEDGSIKPAASPSAPGSPGTRPSQDESSASAATGQPSRATVPEVIGLIVASLIREPTNSRAAGESQANSRSALAELVKVIQSMVPASIRLSISAGGSATSRFW